MGAAREVEAAWMQVQHALSIAAGLERKHYGDLQWSVMHLQTDHGGFELLPLATSVVLVDDDE